VQVSQVKRTVLLQPTKSCQLNKSMELGYVSEAEVVDYTQQESVLTQQLIPAATGLSVNGEERQQLSDELNVYSVLYSTSK